MSTEAPAAPSPPQQTNINARDRAGNPPAPAPKSFAQRRLAQDQAAAAKRPPPAINTIEGYDQNELRTKARGAGSIARTGRPMMNRVAADLAPDPSGSIDPRQMHF